MKLLNRRPHIPFIFIFLLVGRELPAQVSELELKVDGLTCSMCSRTVESALRKLEFVEQVSPNLEETSFDVTIKTGKTINLDRVAKKVKDAGYSLSSCTFNVDFDKAKHISNNCYQFGDMVFSIINSPSAGAQGIHKLRIVGKDFLRTKEWTSYQSKFANAPQCSMNSYVTLYE